MSNTFNNPILPGCYPDPSICRVADEYYLVNSSFEYFPGIPIFNSRDLVHWRLLGHVLDQPSQLPLDGIRSSGGLYAPTIRHHEGVFYVTCTLVDGLTRSGNFIVTTRYPPGPWSEPAWLKDSNGIDPSLFFDDEGTAWFTASAPEVTGFYEGHTHIYLQKINLATMRLVGKRHVLWDGAFKRAIWSEAPHIYKRRGWYYLMTSEGGTAHYHSICVARSRKITGPYESNPANPILTHRHLGMEAPVVGVGHGDLVRTQSGEWWMVLLGMRPYGGYFYNLGRETFLAPVRWDEDWPVVCPDTGKVELSYPPPNLPESAWPPQPERVDFVVPALPRHWNFLRLPEPDSWTLTERSGFLRLHLLPQRLSEASNPAFIGRRQQHISFEASIGMQFKPKSENECAGLVLLQNEQYQFRLVFTRDDNSMTGYVVRLEQRAGGDEKILGEMQIDLPEDGKDILLKVHAEGQDYGFFVADATGIFHTLAQNVDGRILSTPVAGGFLGAFIGLYASSNGQPSQSVADFDFFDYTELPDQTDHSGGIYPTQAIVPAD